MANLPGLGADAKAVILDEAAVIGPCSRQILEALGDTYFAAGNRISAALAYGRSMACSPAHANTRFKYGETLLAMGFIEGLDFIDTAITLEPQNPVFAAERQRLREQLRR
jgi:hypothetical protein